MEQHKDELFFLNYWGRDPYVSDFLPKPPKAGRFEVQIEMASTAGGRSQMFWQEQGGRPSFFRDRSTGIAVKHDGKLQPYCIAFMAAHPLTRYRSRSPVSHQFTHFRRRTKSWNRRMSRLVAEDFSPHGLGRCRSTRAVGTPCGNPRVRTC